MKQVKESTKDTLLLNFTASRLRRIFITRHLNHTVFTRTMLDINTLRVDKGGDPESVRESQRRRFANVDLVDEVIVMDSEWVKLRFSVDVKNREINALQKEIGSLMKAKDKDAADLLVQKKNELTLERDSIKQQSDDKEQERDTRLILIGNMVHSSVPVSQNEDDNVVERLFPADFKPEKRTDILAHDQVLERLGGYDSERGARVAGHRGYYLLNEGLDLNLALINFGLEFLGKKDYTRIQTPFFMKKAVMAKTAQLEQFDEELYKVTAGDEEDKYLIATSEQPISAFHMGEWFEKPKEQLPIKYAGYSTCFRKEAGKAGRDTWGIFRVHQFEKIEQFCITEPEKSWEMFDHMIANSEEFMQALGFKYRVISIVSGALNNAASKKYDLEAWFPYQGEYKELVSCSNCTDYQSRRLEIRCGFKKTGQTEKTYVHCLNSTLCATERTLCCLLENYQTPTGVIVPEVLRKYMGGREFLPYKCELKTVRK